MNVNIIIFDLDDTLYNEIEYVKSGFKEVSDYFSKTYSLNNIKFYNHLLYNLQNFGRGEIFNKTLAYFNILSKKNIKKAVSVYRQHKPKINLPKSSKEILEYFHNKKIPIYIITDGNKIVQNNKIQALNIEKYIKKVYITHRYGIKHSKPSSYCFEKIAKSEKSSFAKIVYIGDNINKDFVNINKLGFKTICIKNGMFIDAQKEKSFHAQIDINSLNELKDIIKIKEKKCQN